jgi:hypothetical protein
MSTMSLILGVLIVSIGSAGAFLVLRRRPPRKGAEHCLRCPGCGLRLRYYARQVGHRGMCRNCKESFIFPSSFATSGPPAHAAG